MHKKERGYISQVAQLAEVSRNTVYKYLRGGNFSMQMRTIQKIEAAIYKVENPSN